MINYNDYLIIGGTTKAGTTSLFKYLSGHPEISTSSLKETRYFLDDNYPLYRPVPFKDDIDTYHALFKNNDNPNAKITIEATPDYLYSKGTPERIQKVLGNKATLIFILRNPVDRFLSWFNFAKQIGEIGDISIDEYISLQKTDGIGKQHERALEQGKYSTYIKKYIDVFGEQNIKIILFEDLSKNPRRTLKNILGSYSVSDEFYDNYEFQIFNKTHQVNDNLFHKLFSIYSKTKKKVRAYTHGKKIHRTLSKLNKIVTDKYFHLNKKTTNSNETINLNFLNDYYDDDIAILEQIINRKTNWH